MQTIRPYELFALLDASPAERIAHVPIPRRRGSGGLTLLETFVIIAAGRIVSARRIFEFGTFLGGTTLNLALNSPEDALILTLDLDSDHAGGIMQDAADAPLTQTHLASKAELDFIGSPVSAKIRTLTGNSTAFDFSVYKGTIDFVFIDGGHDRDTVKSDTENAYRIVRTNGPSCIMWHDYGNPRYHDLTGYLDELALDRQIRHIGDTMLCVWFNDWGTLK